jgi:putative transposase
MSIMEKRSLVSPEYRALSVSDQCKLIGLQRSSYYFKPRGQSLLNQRLMKAIDRQFLDCPFYGVERMRDYLIGLGYHVGVKRVRRLYRLMNLRTIYPKRNLSKANPADYKYPYLLKGLKIERPNQVWQADISYIPMFRGFMYMFAIIDVYSRRIVGWSISNTMSMEWCRETVLDTIPTRVANLRVQDLLIHYSKVEYKSRWMAKEEPSTMFSSNASGDRSNKNTST